MKKIKYSEATLKKFSLVDLQKVCKYYGIKYEPAWKKAKLIKEIMGYSVPDIEIKTHHYSGYDYVPPSVQPIETETKKSTRIQRIDDRKEK